MKIFSAFLLAFLFCADFVQAYVPPSHFIVDRMAKKKAAGDSSLLIFDLLKPSGDPEKLPPSLLWTGVYWYPGAKAEKNSAWPLAALLLENDPVRLHEALKAFGIPVKREEELVIKRSRAEMAKNNPETDLPFYKREEILSVKRLGKRLAWQVSSEDQKKRLLVEKDSSDPVVLAAPCPEALVKTFLGIGQAKAAECSLEFRYENAGGGNPTQVLLKIDGRDFAILRIKRITANPPERATKELRRGINGDSLDNADETVKIFTTHFL